MTGKHHEFVPAEGAHFFPDVHGLPRSQELPFFDIHGPAALGAGFQKIRLAAQKSGNLEQIHVFGGNFRFLGRMHIRNDGQFQLPADFRQNAAAFPHAGTAKRGDLS